jgi:hypothetical protein
MHKVGDSVYVVRSGNWDSHYTAGRVIKVTAGGQVDVVVGTGEPIRFRADGCKQGSKSRWDTLELDTMPFEERKIELAKKERLRHAANLLHPITVNSGANVRWGKEGLIRELDRLQDLINAARAAVEAIDNPPPATRMVVLGGLEVEVPAEGSDA